MTAMRFHLSPHVSACVAAGRFVFLDLRKDRYFCLERTWTDALASVLLPELPSPNTHATRSKVSPDKLIESLVRRGVLTTAPAAARRVLSARDATPAGVLVAEDLAPPRLRVADVWNLAVASTRAAAALKWRTIERVVRSVERRKQSRRANETHCDLDFVRQRVVTFNALRPLLPMNYLCLFDSLALLNFLSCDGIYPTWIFGVRTDPFQAHCWVQENDVVYNDDVEHVQSYTPILMI